MGGRQGRARELALRQDTRARGLHPNVPSSVASLIKLFSGDDLSAFPLDPDRHRHIVSQGDFEEICAEYWSNWEYVHSPALNEAKPWAKKVQIAIRNLSNLLDSGDAFANDALLILSPAWESDLQTRFAQLDSLDAACQDILETSTPRGPKRKAAATATVKRLVKMWEHLSGDDFSRNFKPSAPKSQEFASLSGRFVHRVMVGVDPSLKFSEVQSALRNAFSRDH